jgi:hypothetical protein
MSDFEDCKARIEALLLDYEAGSRPSITTSRRPYR